MVAAVESEPQTAAEEEALRRSVRRGAPFGGEKWARSTAARLGIVVGVGLVVNAPWLVPSLVRPGGVPVRPEGVEAFAARPDPLDRLAPDAEAGKASGKRGPAAILYELNPRAGWVVAGLDYATHSGAISLTTIFTATSTRMRPP